MTLQAVNKDISKSSTVVAANNQISSDIGGEAVILNLKSGVYHGLNAVGARIWNLIQQPNIVENIQQVLLDEYEVEPEVCISDLLALLNEFYTAGLIEVRNETAA
jgi:hypothetical protein